MHYNKQELTEQIQLSTSILSLLEQDVKDFDKLTRGFTTERKESNKKTIRKMIAKTKRKITILTKKLNKL